MFKKLKGWLRYLYVYQWELVGEILAIILFWIIPAIVFTIIIIFGGK